MMKTYQGSCHCRSIRLEADIDLSAGTNKCNCTYCWKIRWWSAIVKPDAFRLLAGREELGYAFPTDKPGTRALCKACGVISFGWGHVPQTSWVSPTCGLHRMEAQIANTGERSYDIVAVRRSSKSPMCYPDRHESNDREEAP